MLVVGLGGGSVPAHLTTQEFLRPVRRAVTPGGVVVGNLRGRGPRHTYFLSLPQSSFSRA